MLKQSFKLFKLAYRANPKEVRTNLGLAIALEILAVLGLFYLNQVRGGLYDGIQKYNVEQIWTSIAYFCGIAIILVAINGYLGYFINRLSFAIRTGLTLLELNQHDYRGDVPNYTQRVQEDFRKFGESFCELWHAILKSAFRLPIFIGVIMMLTSAWTGVIVVGAVIVGTIATRLAARRLVGDQAIQESNEAVFRTQLNEHHYAKITAQFYVINGLFKRLSFIQSGLGQAFVLLPFILLMPLYISKTIAMGAFFQSVDALGKIIDSLTVLIDSRQIIVNLETCIVRLNFLTKEV
jgi:ABC-type uncharacterized transport system fused permease/ATPase subunit